MSRTELGRNLRFDQQFVRLLGGKRRIHPHGGIRHDLKQSNRPHRRFHGPLEMRFLPRQRDHQERIEMVPRGGGRDLIPVRARIGELPEIRRQPCGGPLEVRAEVGRHDARRR